MIKSVKKLQKLQKLNICDWKFTKNEMLIKMKFLKVEN